MGEHTPPHRGLDDFRGAKLTTVLAWLPQAPGKAMPSAVEFQNWTRDPPRPHFHRHASVSITVGQILCSALRFIEV